MQGSKSSSFIKSLKRAKYFDDGYSGRQNNKKNDYHRKERAKANRQQPENQQQVTK